MKTLTFKLTKSILMPVLVFFIILASGCSKTFEKQNPVGVEFSSVRANPLEGDRVNIPEIFKGEAALLLVGYVQDAQFDIDRWILALKQLKTPISIAELPTIQGFFPRMISSTIDGGMRSGIPEEDWKIVFTVYEDSEIIASSLGNTKPLNARVVLLDSNGVVSWFHDRGYSADLAIELDRRIREEKSK